MMPSSPSPKLPKWIFFVTDAVLLLAAWLIASRSPGPLSSTAILAITACVIVGAIVGTVPLLLHYEREKNETLDDRQRALEALALTLTTAADQISIAAKGLHEIAEITQKNLKLAEQLPQKLQDKVAEFQAQLGSARDEERDELKKDLTALRAVESGQLAATADKVQKAAAELTKLEAAAQKSLAAIQAAGAKTPEALATATAAAVAAVEAKLAAGTSAALAEVEAKLAAGTAATLAAIEAAEAKRASQAQAEAAAAAVEPPGPPGGIERRKTPQRRSTDIGRHITPVVPPTSAPFTGNIVSLSPASAEPVADEVIGQHITPVVPPTSAPFTGNIVSVSPAPDTPAADPAPASTVADDTPIPEEPKSKTVSTADPFRQPPAAPTPDAADAASAPTATAPETPAGAEPRPAKKRAPRKPKPAESADAALELGIVEPAAPAAADDFSQVPPNEPAEKAISADGATRLLVTAYIGIGNRLFIRGEGPGLSWDKGVPLQFVSIGKWRWETADATAPVNYKLYKNDELECSALGAQSLDSGHQQEVTATF